MKKKHFTSTEVFAGPQKAVCGRIVSDIFIGKTHAFPQEVTCKSCKKSKAFKKRLYVYGYHLERWK